MPVSRWIRARALYARYLLKEFRWPILVFSALVLFGGLLLRASYHERPLSYSEAFYAVFVMVFFEQTLPFPSEWPLQVMFYVVPIIGLGAVADSVGRLWYLLFTGKRKLQEWQLMQASMKRNHIVVAGIGKVGYRIVRNLLALKEDVVAIERREDAPFVAEILDEDVTVIFGDARQKKTLENAGVAHARAVILATDDDLANLDAALTAREIRPGVRLVMRLFDDTLATKVASTFNIPALSPAVTAAPVFVAAATGRSVYHSFQLDGDTLHVSDLVIASFAGRRVGDVQSAFAVNIVMHKRGASSNVNPGHDLVLERGDKLLVIAPLEKFAAFEAGNR